MLQLRSVNARLRAQFSDKLELVQGDGYLYFVYDDPEFNKYETESVAIFRLNHQDLSGWIADAESFLRKFRLPYKGMPVQSAERCKENGDYRTAGQLRRLEGSDSYYGCHFGMRSTRDAAIREFTNGWNEIDRALSGHQN